MHVEIRIRWVHILFTSKELKVLLVPQGTDAYVLPEDSGQSTNPGKYSTKMLAPFTASHGHFISQVNNPVLQRDNRGSYMTFDYYILMTPEMTSRSSDSGKWISVHEALQHKSHISLVISATIKKLRQDLNHQLVEYYLLPIHFTIPELQRLYELILGKELDRANFFRRVLTMDILICSGERKLNTKSKPPMLYTFNNNYFKKTEQGATSIF